jgi:inorganic pyrophosphatase
LEPIEVIVEIPRGSRNKYEFDQKRQRFCLDRVLYASVHYPADYGYVVDTLGDDGDPLDALVVVDEPTFPGCIVEARPIGVLGMRDEKGPDDKLLTVPVGDPRFNQVADVSDLPPSQLAEIEYFFATYKTLERKLTEMIGWQGWQAAEVLLREAREGFRRHRQAGGPVG